MSDREENDSGEHPTRWKKGCSSPNPRGRPRRKSKNDLFRTVNSELAKFLAADRKVVGYTEDGEPITRGESLDLHLFRQATTDARFMKLYLAQRNAATAAEREVRETSLIAAMEYQNRNLPLALQAERMGKRVRMLPDPRDIEIDGLQVRVNGPVTEMDLLIVEGIVKQRDAIHKSVPFILEATHLPVEERRDLWKYVRRRHYRLEAKLPPRLKKKFPEWVEFPASDQSDCP